MTAPLNSVTQKPILLDQIETYGGDDTKLGQEGFIALVVQWDINEQQDCFKSNFVFVVKKAFEFLNCIGITFFQDQFEECYTYQTGFEHNKLQRQRIVEALGGEEVCENIPVVQLQEADFTPFLTLSDRDFRSGDWVVQGEDPAGRKFVGMRLEDRRTHEIKILTVFQRVRETCINPKGESGDAWYGRLERTEQGVNFFDGLNGPLVAFFINQVRASQDDQFAIAMKP